MIVRILTNCQEGFHCTRMTPEELRNQELKIKELWESGEIPSLLHLCGGNEEWLCRYFKEHVGSSDWIFASHRCHFTYTLAGHTDLIDQVLMGRSMFLYGPRFVCSAIVGGVLSIACGKALGIQLRGGAEKVHCFCGDGATDQGAFWEAVRFAEARDLPLTFVVEDNGGQCGVSMDQRWGGDRPNCVNPQYLLHSLTKVKWYSYTPTYPHAGCLSPDGTPTRPKLRNTLNAWKH